jgi:inorganic pyrophosphatase
MKKPETLTVMIESPKSSKQKFDFDPKEKRFTLSKMLPAGLAFPFDFGMIPGSKGQDCAPLDIIIISECGTFPGCLVNARIVGAFKAEQTERDGQTMRNDRFIGVPDVSQQFAEVKTIKDLPESILNQLEHFFKNYNEQAGKQFRVIARLTAAEALKLLT